MNRCAWSYVAVLAVLTIAPCLTGPTSAAAAYRAVDVGALQYAHAYPGDPAQGAATDINNYGQIVGYSYTTEQRYRRGMIWQPTGPNAATGTLHDVADVTDLPTASVSAINNRGQFFAYDKLFTPTARNGLTGTLTSGVEQLPNESGQFSTIRDERLARIEPDGTVTYLTAPGTAVLAWTDAINDAGHIVGHGETNFFVWSPDAPGAATGVLRDLGVAHRRLERSILTPGGVVGMSFVYGNFPMPGRPSSYLWLPPTADQSDGTLVDLPTRLGTPVVELIDVNDVGQLLVGLYDANSGVLGYYLLTPDEAAVDGYARLRLDTFNETLPQGGRFGGMIPTALNDLGQIVGDGGWSYDGGQTWRMHATLLTAVPEPGAVALAIVASFGLLARHRRL